MRKSTEPAVDFKTAFAALVDEMADEAHPTDDELVAYHAGELPGQRRSAVEEHLLTCRECFALVRDLKSFSDAERGAPPAPADFETAAFYRTLKRSLGDRRRNVLAALAAAFGVATLGLTLWAVSQQRTMTAQEESIARLSAIQPNVAFHDFLPDRRDGSSAVPEVLSGSGAILILVPESSSAAESFEARILDDATDSLVRTVRNLKQDPRDGTFTLWLPPHALAPGEYRIEIHAAAGQPVGEYRMTVAGAHACRCRAACETLRS